MPGGQWRNGAVGNALWTGVRLKDLLAKAMPKAGAVDVTLRGLDGPVLNTTPPFVKSLPIDKAGDGEALVAYAMNGQPLPMLNGFPIRLVVPGWFATYWVKALHGDHRPGQVRSTDSGWAKAYRVPVMPNYSESPASPGAKDMPISVMTTRSLIVRVPSRAIACRPVENVSSMALRLTAEMGSPRSTSPPDRGLLVEHGVARGGPGPLLLPAVPLRMDAGRSRQPPARVPRRQRRR